MKLALFLQRLAGVRRFHIRDLSRRLYSHDFPSTPEPSDLRKFIRIRILDDDFSADEVDEIQLFLHKSSGSIFYQFNFSASGRLYPWTFDTNQMIVVRVRRGLKPYVILGYLP